MIIYVGMILILSFYFVYDIFQPLSIDTLNDSNLFEIITIDHRFKFITDGTIHYGHAYDRHLCININEIVIVLMFFTIVDDNHMLILP